MGTHREALEGVRILDLSRQVAGAAGTRILANYGAEVLRVEWPDPPGFDFIRLIVAAEGEVGPNRGGIFNSANVDKRSFTLNMGTKRGRKVARDLVRISDVVYENMTPRVMKGWGLDYGTLIKLKPDIIYVSCSGFGQTGPFASYRSYGIPSAAHTGLDLLVGLPGRPPGGWAFQFGDTFAAAVNAATVLTALEYRRETGRGVFIDSAQTQGNVTLQSQFLLEHSVNGRLFRRDDYPDGNTRYHPASAPHNVYACQGDDAWCAIAVYSDEEWSALKDAIGSPAWSNLPEFSTNALRFHNRTALDANLTRWTSTHDKFELAENLQRAGVRAAAVENVRDRMDADPQLAHRGTYVKYPHPEVGERRHEGVAAKLSASPYRIKSGAPLLGEHNDYVYRQLLGLSNDEIEELKRDDVIR